MTTSHSLSAPNNMSSTELACMLILYVKSFTRPFLFCLCNSLQKQMLDSLWEVTICASHKAEGKCIVSE